MTILISFYTVNCTGHNGHLRDELYATLDKGVIPTGNFEFFLYNQSQWT